ncbi:hypothetical protein PS914_02070 [Pseudomonas fluorescens]|nr:hypothetical protein PS914_02070 [Pseudomonas fluorescens]
MAGHTNTEVLAFYIPEAFFYLHPLLVNRHDFRRIPLSLRQVTGQQPRLSLTIGRLSAELTKNGDGFINKNYKNGDGFINKNGDGFIKDKKGDY